MWTLRVQLARQHFAPCALALPKFLRTLGLHNSLSLLMHPDVRAVVLVSAERDWLLRPMAWCATTYPSAQVHLEEQREPVQGDGGRSLFARRSPQRSR